MLLKVIDTACEDTCNQLVEMGSRPAIEHAMMQARAMTAPLQGFAMVRFASNRIEFQNGSRVQFITSEQAKDPRPEFFAGIRYLQVVRDVD